MDEDSGSQECELSHSCGLWSLKHEEDSHESGESV